MLNSVRHEGLDLGKTSFNVSITTINILIRWTNNTARSVIIISLYLKREDNM